MNPFQLLIKPVSGDCNQNCSYCFYKEVPSIYYSNDSIHRMEKDILKELIYSYLKLGFNENIFSWQGGEPTLAGIEFFKDVIRYQKRFGKSGQVIGNAIQTNGFLINQQWAKLLYEYNFLVGLSIDGPEKIHDSARGKGTWAAAMEAVEILRQNKVEFNVLTVVHKNNINQASKIYQFHKENGFEYLQFIPAVDIDPCTGNPAIHSVSPNAYGQFLISLFNEWVQGDDVGKISIRFFNAMAESVIHEETNLCTVSKKCGPYLVIEYNGDVYPCDFFVRPSWLLGNIKDDDWRELMQKRSKLASKKGNLDSVCHDCQWLDLCHGGCPKNRQFSDNPHPSRSYLCEGYQKFFEHSSEWLDNTLRRVEK